jgi:hypothetical protein
MVQMGIADLTSSTEVPERASMHTVTMSKSKLMDALRTNRDAHRAMFEEALEAYRVTVVQELDRRLKDAKAGRKYDGFMRLEQPVDHTDDYDRVILSLDFSLFDEVELSMQDFNQYVRDNWSWKEQFLTTSNNYIASANAR